MKEEEFRKLLEKAIKGNLTEEESQILQRFEERLEKTDTPFFENETSKTQLKGSIWHNILAEIKRKSKLKRWRRFSASAALVVGLLSGGYFYLQKTRSVSNATLENVITLELEDGTIKVLEETQKTNLTNTSGEVVGQQNKNQLVYKETTQRPQKLVYNTLTIPYGKTFQIVLSDGTRAHLNAGSSLKYPVQFLQNQTRQVFVKGEVFLDVAKDKARAFVVNADNLNVEVYGTQFNVYSYPEDELAEVVLVEGSVGLYTESKDSAQPLEPGFKASFNKANHEITKTKVITNIYTSWMKGELVFRNMTFNNILKKLERKYDVVIKNNNTNISNEKFNASLGVNPSINEVLEELKLNYNLDYKIEQNIITIN
ncbi:FecR family protein [Seonamhaeicola marinus]|uniref:DUF4974 domain-containing protein n=1 Tax=Seonamhaeicola marinus TaxID=1912246 RepID=A0A5D0HRN5_9FLAO|nr:FecR family protein [Seonamhaeicola marinus]TYA73994.1 DUF4974 domain-containing protein [Seonamhaeicola marinus]